MVNLDLHAVKKIIKQLNMCNKKTQSRQFKAIVLQQIGQKLQFDLPKSQFG